MSIYGRVIPQGDRLARLVDLSKAARQRLKWFDDYAAHKRNARLTCRHFDISPQTFYRWQRRFNARNLRSWKATRAGTQRLRQPTAPPELIEAVQRVREQYPR